MRVEIVMVHMKLCHASSGKLLFGQQKDLNIIEIGHNASGNRDGAHETMSRKQWKCAVRSAKGFEHCRDRP